MAVVLVFCCFSIFEPSFLFFIFFVWITPDRKTKHTDLNTPHSTSVQLIVSDTGCDLQGTVNCDVLQNKNPLRLEEF